MTGSSYLAEVARESELFRAVLEKPFDLDELLLQVSERRLAADRAGNGELEASLEPAESTRELVARA